MFKVSIVGHSQVPYSLETGLENTELRIYRKPGARARSFFVEERLTEVLEWNHDLTIL